MHAQLNLTNAVRVSGTDAAVLYAKTEHTGEVAIAGARPYVWAVFAPPRGTGVMFSVVQC